MFQLWKNQERYSDNLIADGMILVVGMRFGKTQKRR